MLLARVIGNIVATRKEDTLVGFKLLLVQELHSTDSNENSKPLVAVDTLGAGRDDVVLVVRGGGARVISDMHHGAPVDAAIVGIVDSVDVFE